MISHDDIAINELLRRVAADDEGAFRQVYDRFKKPFYAAALKTTHATSTAEDIVQEVFILLWDKRLLVAAADNPKAYLLTMLHNCIYMELRKVAAERLRVQKLIITHRDTGSDDSPEDHFLQKEDRQLLESLINRLPGQQRLVYRLAKQEGLSRDEIAERLNLSPNTVRNHLAAAVNFIRDNTRRQDIRLLIWLAILLSL